MLDRVSSRRRARSGARALAGALSLGAAFAAAPACSNASGASGATGDGGPASWPTVAAANALPNTDPRAEGQYRFLYDAFGSEVLGEWPPADFMIDLQKSQPAVFGNQFAGFGFIPDPNDDLPIGFKRGLVDPTKVHETCALCHTGVLPDGRLWLGAPNTRLDIEGFTLAVEEAWVAAGHAPSSGSLDDARASAKAAGPGRFDVFAVSAGFPVPVPAKLPSAFQLGQRAFTNYLGTGHNLKTETYLAILAFGPGDTTKATPIPFPDDDRLSKFMAYFGTIDPPKATGLDPSLVARGAQVFASAKCNLCHHPDDVASDGVVTVPSDATVPESLPGANPTYPRGVVQTDPLHRTLLSVGFTSSDDGGASDAGSALDPSYLALLQFIQDHGLSVAFSDGYRAGYLGGLWARAPYLHNGSVPTLRDLLSRAAERPKAWPIGAFTVDTTASGNGNEGHEFGIDLSSDDKTALIAYLDSL